VTRIVGSTKGIVVFWLPFALNPPVILSAAKDLPRVEHGSKFFVASLLRMTRGKE
jgi:hypothetical protein